MAFSPALAALVPAEEKNTHLLYERLLALHAIAAGKKTRKKAKLPATTIFVAPPGHVEGFDKVENFMFP